MCTKSIQTQNTLSFLHQKLIHQTTCNLMSTFASFWCCNVVPTFGTRHGLLSLCWNTQFHIVKKKNKILKSYFLKMGFFQIPFLKSHNSVSFWARKLGEVLFDSKFFTDYHTSCNFISTEWDLLPGNVTYIEVVKKSVKKFVELFKMSKNP